MSNELFNINLIDAYIIKKECPEIPSSVDDALIASSIIDSQEEFIEPILGCKLYQEILLQHSTNTLTIPNAYLYNRFIVKIIAKRTASKLIYFSSYQFENSGIRVKEGTEQSRPADHTEMITLNRIYEASADRITQKMIVYINSNITDYSSFYESTYCSCKSNASAFSGIKLGGF